MKTLIAEYPMLQTAHTMEDVLCLGTLIANGELPPTGTIKQAQEFFKVEAKGECFPNCPFRLTCLACIINE